MPAQLFKYELARELENGISFAESPGSDINLLAGLVQQGSSIGEPLLVVSPFYCSSCMGIKMHCGRFVLLVEFWVDESRLLAHLLELILEACAGWQSIHS